MTHWYEWLTPVYNDLMSAHQKSRLAHLHILSGHGDIGQSHLASRWISYLFCQNPKQDSACQSCRACRLYQAGQHPDCVWLHGDEGIGIDAMRQAVTKLERHPVIAPLKILVLDYLDVLSLDAFQAGLKLFEEPGDNVFIVLLHRQQQSIPATLRSRSQIWMLPVTYKQWEKVVDEPSLFKYQWLNGSLKPLNEVQKTYVNKIGLFDGRLLESMIDEFTADQLLDFWYLELLARLRKMYEDNILLNRWQYFQAVDDLCILKQHLRSHNGLSTANGLFYLWHQLRRRLGII
mgnify:CR=1 FL=1